MAYGEEICSDVDVAWEEPTTEDVKSIVNQLKNKKSPGDNKIRNEMLQYGGQEVHEEISSLIQQILKEEKMLTNKTNNTKGDSRKCDNYRGIALLDTVYKCWQCVSQTG